MKKKFIVLIDTESENQAILFREFLDKKGLGWWHWLSNSWLVADLNGTFTIKTLMDEVQKAFPNVNCLVTEGGSDGTWVGYGPANEESSNFFPWLKKSW